MKSHSFLTICYLLWLMIRLLGAAHFTNAAGIHSSTTVKCHRHEREALLKIKQFITRFVDVDTWVGEDCCQWQGVGCDNVTGNVISFHTGDTISIYCTLFQGPCTTLYPAYADDVLGPFLGLEDLRYLNLSNAQIIGNFPPQLGNLTNLEVLDLSSNKFTGSVPPQLGNLTNLEVLDLSSNGLTGSVPPQLGNLTKLEILDISYNSLTGVIPYSDSFYDFLPSYLGRPKNLKSLSLSNNFFYGQISDLLEHYNGLQFLDLSHNQINGTLPSSLGQLKRLKHLDLSSNSFQGTLSVAHIGNLSKLSYLDISNNNISLNLPSDWLPPFQLDKFFVRSCKIDNPLKWLHTQASITELDLSNTGISGKLEFWLPNTSNLYGLNLSNNFLAGPLPERFPTQQISYLDIHNNNLSGSISDWLSHLVNASYVDLSSNHFSGSLPFSMGQDCQLQLLSLKNNSLEGVIPPSLGKCTYLQLLDLGVNKLSGRIPTWTSNDLPSLEVLQLQENQLGGPDDETHDKIPESLCDLSLIILALQNNLLSGRIPDCWGNSTQLKVINLSSNNLSGVIPCSFGKLTYLAHLHLNDNKLHGRIPSCLHGLGNLKILDVGENKLFGKLPTWLNGEVFAALAVLRLPGNILNGTIPHQLCSLSFLRVLDVSNNQLTGNIPPCVGKLTGINVHPANTEDYFPSYEFDRPRDKIEKTMDVSRENGINETIAGIARQYSTNLKYLATIDLSRNNLLGAIPEELMKLSGLIALNLAGNQLTGKIPEKIGEMKALETLDLSENQLCGRIPIGLRDIDSLNHLNLSSNNLFGPIPSSNHFETLADDPSIFMGNPYLCGDFLPKKCSSQGKVPDPNTSGDEDKDDAEDYHEKMWFYLVVMLGMATGFWGVIATLLLKKKWRHAFFRPVEDVSDWLYVAIALKVSKMKKVLKMEDNSG